MVIPLVTGEDHATKRHKKHKIIAFIWLCTKSLCSASSLCNLCVLCVSVVVFSEASLWPLSHDVGETLAGAGEPPVAEEEDDQGKGCEVGETAPIGGRAIQKNATIA